MPSLNNVPLRVLVEQNEIDENRLVLVVIEFNAEETDTLMEVDVLLEVENLLEIDTPIELACYRYIKGNKCLESVKNLRLLALYCTIRELKYVK